MRFRMGTTGQDGGNVFDGVSRGMQSLGMLPLMQAQAAEEGRMADLKSRGLEAQIADHMADAALKKQTLDRGTMPNQVKTVGLMHGVPLHQADEFGDFMQSGQLAPRYELPSDLQGPTMARPGYASPDAVQQVTRALGLQQQALTVGDKSVKHIADATGEYQSQGLREDVLAGRRNAADVGRATAATKGTALVNNIGNSGRGFDIFSGAGMDMHPGMAALFDKGELAQINQRNAAGRASDASADNSRASAAKTRAEMEQGVKGANQQVVQDSDGNFVIVDKVTGLARPAVGLDGKPVRKAGGGAGGKLPGEIQRMTIAMEALEGGLDSYEKMLTEFNPRGMSQFSPEQRARIKSLMADMQMQYKEAQALGALNGPDLEVLARAMTDPATLAGATYGRPGLNAQVKQAREALSRRRMALASQFNRPDLGPKDGAGAGDPLGLFNKR
jgi:hypothetical protein